MTGKTEKYELSLTHEQADIIYRMARGNPAFGVTWAEIFKLNIPIQLPTGLGAVIRTAKGVFVHADPGSAHPWVNADGAEGPYWRAPGDIGHVIFVLSEGVSNA